MCDKSRAASTSSRMYSGAGLNRSSARMSERATSDLWDVVGKEGMKSVIEKRRRKFLSGST